MLTDSTSCLEDQLCAYFGRKHCCFTGRGATAIYLALRALPVKSGKVILPAVVCPSPANAVLYAGFEPVFCDVSLEDYNIDIQSLEKVATSYDDVVAIIPVHLYGQPADMDRVSEVARRHNLFVIEDAAQAMGAEYRGKKVGTFGDMSVISFGHTKILDVGWGGATLTDDEELARCMRAELSNLPECPANTGEMFAEYRKVYYTLKPLTEMNERLNDLFLPLPLVYREMYLFQPVPGSADEITVRLAALEEVVQKRQDNAAEYAKRLRHPDIIQPAYRHTGVPWRFSFLLRRDIQKPVTEQMRAAGIDVSNWYPPLYRWYASGKAQDRNLFPNADFLGTHIINLWVDQSVDHNYISRACNTLLNILENVPVDKHGGLPNERRIGRGES